MAWPDHLFNHIFLVKLGFIIIKEENGEAKRKLGWYDPFAKKDDELLSDMDWNQLIFSKNLHRT
ncbi:hypothetical protein GCM10027516_33810 [Niabella aquatica]